MCANCDNQTDHEFPTDEPHTPPPMLFVVLISLGVIGITGLVLAIINFNKLETAIEENEQVIERVEELENQFESLE